MFARAAQEMDPEAVKTAGREVSFVAGEAAGHRRSVSVAVNMATGALSERLGKDALPRNCCVPT